MEQTTIMKDCEVEVFSVEEGLGWAWFRAILEENPTNSGRKKLRVRYLTLLDYDGSSLLIEHIDRRFIRPVPPDNLNGGVDFEEGSVVDADYKEGWRTGVVIKKTEDDNYLVYFYFPPDILQFERKQLRAHFIWTSGRWVRKDTEELGKPMFSSGTMVEVSSAKDAAWFPSLIIKEIEVDNLKKFIVKDWNKYLSCNGDKARLKRTIGSRWVRPTPPLSLVEKYTLTESVEAFRGSGWHQGLVRAVLSEKRYMVSLEATKEESIFKHSDLRPFMVWEDGIWHNAKKPKPKKETSSNVIKKKPMYSSSGAKLMVYKRATQNMRSSLNPEEIAETLTKAEATGGLGKKRADAVMIDKTPPVITPQVASIANQSISPVTPAPVIKISPVTPSPVIMATPLKQREDETEGKKSAEMTLEQMKNQKGLDNIPAGHESLRRRMAKIIVRKRKREQKHKSDLNETDETCNGSKAEISDTKLSSGQSPSVVDNCAAHGEKTQAKSTLMNLPFAKKLPYWKIHETEEAYKTVPQNPHFSPLFKANEDIREWSAVGMMVSFYGLLEEVKDLQLDVPSSKLNNLASSFAELEKHGFDVATPQSWIKKVLSLQDWQARKAEERQCRTKKIEVGKLEMLKFEDEMDELECKILEMKRQKTVAKEKKEAAEKVIVEMESSVGTIDQEIEDVKLEFTRSVFAP